MFLRSLPTIFTYFINIFRSSASVPTSYSSRLTDLHDSTSRLTTKERADTNDNILNYRRSSKTDSDVAATLEKYGLKSDTYKIRNDSMPSRFLNTSNLDSKYSTSNRKLTGSSAFELSRSSSSSAKPPKSGFSSRLQRKDSLTKSENVESNQSPIRSLERKISSSAIAGSSSPIEIRKPSEVWDKPLSVSYGETISRSVFDNDLFQKVDNRDQSRLGSKESNEDENLMFFENLDTEEKTLTFDEIRKKFDNDTSTLKGGFENGFKASQDEPKTSVSNGLILGVHNFSSKQYLDLNAKNQKTDSNNEEIESFEPGQLSPNIDSNSDSFCSPQTLRRTVLKPIPGSVKNSSSNLVLRKSPDLPGEISSAFKKKSSPDLKKISLSEKKEGTFSNLAKLPAIPSPDIESFSTEKVIVDGLNTLNAIEAKREARNASINSKLGLETRSSLKIQPKTKGEKLLTKVEQTLSKEPEVDSNEMLMSLTRLRKSPETKPKDFENQTKVIELRRMDVNVGSPFQTEAKEREEVMETEKHKERKSESPKLIEKSQKFLKTLRNSPNKETEKTRDTNSSLSPLMSKKESNLGTKARGSSSPKEEKDSQNARERELNNKLLMEELTKDLKIRKEEKESEISTKEAPIWDKQDLSNIGNRNFSGQASTSNGSNTHSYNDRMVSF